MSNHRRTPITLRADVPGVGWVNLPTYLQTKIADIDWDHRLPGGPAKLNAKLIGEHRLIPGTLLAVFDGSCPVWSGEIEATDSDPQSRTTSITGRGRVDTMQDGLIYDKTYVRAGVDGGIDDRSIAGTALTNKDMAAEIKVEGGALSIQHAQGVPCIAGFHAVAMFDMGPNNLCSKMAFDYQTSGNTGNHLWYIFGSSTPYYSGGTVLLGTGGVAMNAGGAGPARYGNIFTGSTAFRYVFVLTYCTAGYTPGAPVWARFWNMLFATNNGYIGPSATFASTLLSSDVAADLVANAGIPNISPSTALIATGTTPIEELESKGDNPKGVLDRANAVDGRQWAWTSDPIPALLMRAEPTTARWAPLPGEFTIEGGARASSIADVYNRVMVLWTGPDGTSNTTIATLTPDTTILARTGRTRTAVVRVSRKCSSAEAAAIAATFLREHRVAAMKAQVKTSVPWVRAATGQRMPVTMLQVGDRIRLPIRDAATGAIGREGTIYGVSVNPRTGVATISLDSDQTLFDRQLAYFESRAS